MFFCSSKPSVWRTIWVPHMVAGTCAPAASQGVSYQEARIGTGSSLKLRHSAMVRRHPDSITAASPNAHPSPLHVGSEGAVSSLWIMTSGRKGLMSEDGSSMPPSAQSPLPSSNQEDIRCFYMPWGREPEFPFMPFTLSGES